MSIFSFSFFVKMYFWSLHFRLIYNLVHKLISLLGQSLISKIVFKIIHTVNPVTENAEVANGGPNCQTLLLK